MLRIALILLFATTAAARSWLSVVPPDPTTSDDVVVRVPVSCNVAGTAITRDGNDIRIVLEISNCPSPPFLIPYDISLGELPAGEYRIELIDRISEEPHTDSFIVLEAVPLVTVHPFVVPVDTPGFPIHLIFSDDYVIDCGGSNPCNWAIEIGGVRYRAADQLPARDGTWFNAPDLAPGLHEIRLIDASGTITVPAAIYYYAPGMEPDRSVFERVLFPVLFRSAGTNGSDWRSEGVIANPTEFAVTTANTVGAATPLEPETRYAFEGDQSPHGIALMVPRRDSDDLAFRLRIRDVSREEESFGTEVPVVRESDMFEDQTMTLLDVPLDPRYRTKLRIYAFPHASEDYWIVDVNNRVVPTGGGEPFGVHVLLKKGACAGAACAWTPYYGEVDLPARGKGERADVYTTVSNGGPAWAFASVTNNKTQEVTLVTPPERPR